MFRLAYSRLASHTLRQYLYFCTSKASKLSTFVHSGLELQVHFRLHFKGDYVCGRMRMRLRQYLCICTRQASNLSTCGGGLALLDERLERALARILLLRLAHAAAGGFQLQQRKQREPPFVCTTKASTLSTCMCLKWTVCRSSSCEERLSSMASLWARSAHSSAFSPSLAPSSADMLRAMSACVARICARAS